MDSDAYYLECARRGYKVVERVARALTKAGVPNTLPPYVERASHGEIDAIGSQDKDLVVHLRDGDLTVEVKSLGEWFDQEPSSFPGRAVRVEKVRAYDKKEASGNVAAFWVFVSTPADCFLAMKNKGKELWSVGEWGGKEGNLVPWYFAPASELRRFDFLTKWLKERA